MILHTACLFLSISILGCLASLLFYKGDKDKAVKYYVVSLVFASLAAYFPVMESDRAVSAIIALMQVYIFSTTLHTK